LIIDHNLYTFVIRGYFKIKLKILSGFFKLLIYLFPTEKRVAFVIFPKNWNI